MNERDDPTESTEPRQKKRRSGFRFSSKKVLECSRVKRETAKFRGIQFESVTKALAYPSEIVEIVPHDSAVESTFQPCLDSVEEHERVGIELSCGNAITYDECNIEVSNFYFQIPYSL
jgi:hypothetical protein